MGLYDNWANKHNEGMKELIEKQCKEKLDLGIHYIRLKEIEKNLADNGIVNLINLRTVISDLDCKILVHKNKEFVVFKYHMTLDDLEKEIKKHELSPVAENTASLLGAAVCLLEMLVD